MRLLFYRSEDKMQMVGIVNCEVSLYQLGRINQYMDLGNFWLVYIRNFVKNKLIGKIGENIGDQIKIYLGLNIYVKEFLI